MTLVQLVTAQQQRELRAQPQSGIVDWIAIPLFGAFVVGMLIWFCVAGTAAALFQLLRRPTMQPKT